MEPYYWRKDQFDGLRSLAETLRTDPHLTLLAKYCELLEKGLRKQAIVVSRQFVESTGDWPESDRRVATDKLMAYQFRSPGIWALINHPIMHGLVRPTMERWVEEEPENPIVLRWHGKLTNDYSALEKAIVVAPEDDLVRLWLIEWLLGDADFAMHHLSESLFLGDEEEAGKWLQQAHIYISEAGSPELFETQREEHESLSRLLQDWHEYKKTTSDSFPDWCNRLGKKHAWWKAYYYNK